MDEDKYVIPQEIIDLGNQLIELYKYQCKQLKPNISYIINRTESGCLAMSNGLNSLRYY